MVDSARSDATGTGASPEGFAEPRVARLSALLKAAGEAGAQLARTSVEPEVYEAVCRVAVRDLHNSPAWIGLAEPGTRAIRVQTSFGEPAAFLSEAGLENGSLITSDSVVRLAVSSHASQVVDHLTSSDQACSQAAVRHGLHSMAVVPLRAGRITVGVLVCYAAERDHFGAEEIAILEALAAQAMTRIAAIEKDRHHEEARTALARTEERYRRLFESAPLGVMVVGPGRVEVNDSLLAMFGYEDRDEFGSRDLAAVVTADCRDDIEAFLGSLAGDERTPAIIRVTGLRADGTVFPLLVDGSQADVGDGAGGIYFLTDLEPMEAAEDLARTARGQYRSLVEGAPLPIVSMDFEGVVRSWNPAAERAFGWSAAEAIGRTFPGGLSAHDRRHFDQVASGAASSGEPHETRLRRRDGKGLELRLWASPTVDAAGTATGLLVIAEDVTTERRLAADRTRLAAAIEQTAESVVVTDLRAGIVYVNPAFERVTGYSRAEVLGKNPRILQSGDHSSDFYREIWEVLTSGRTWVGEFVNKRKDGARFIEEATISPIRGEGGRVSGYVGVKRDVTVERAEKAALEATERSYKSLFDNMQEGLAYHRMIFVDGEPVDYVFLSANSAFEELTGLHNVVGKRVSEVIPGILESDPQLFEVYGRVASGGPPEKFRTDVASLDMSFSISVYSPEPGRFATIFENVTEQVRAERAVRNMNALLERTEAISRTGSWRWTVGTDVLICSREMFEIFGIERAEPGPFTIEGFGERVHPDDRAMLDESIAAIRRGEPPPPTTYRVVLPDGSVRVVLGNGELELDESGRMVAAVGYVQDVTARKQAEDALREQQTLLRSVVNATPDAIFAKDLRGRYLLLNDEVTRVAGKPAEELIGRDDTALFPPDEARAVMERDRWVLESGGPLTLEEEVTDASGTRRWYMATKGPLVGADGSVIGLYGVSRDITDRKHAELVEAARSRLLSLSLSSSLDQLLESMLTEAEDLTGSQIGFYHFVDEDEHELTLTQRSPRTKDAFCETEGAGRHYAIDEAGVLVDCIRERKPVIHNDYASLPGRNGLPEGHAPVIRELVVPIFRGDKIRAIVGVGNKPGDYHDSDVEGVSRLADLAFDIAERKRAEDELRRSEAIYRTLLDKAPIAIGAHRGGAGLFANEAHRRLFGYAEPEDLERLGPDDMIAPESHEFTREVLRRRAEGLPVQDEYELVGQRRDGTKFPMLIRSTSVELPDGPATMLFHLDLTEIRKAQETIRQSEEKFSTAFRSAPILVSISDLATGAYLDVNDAVIRTSGFGRDELIGNDGVEIGWVSLADQQRVRDLLEREGRVEALQMTRRTRDGRAIEVLMHGEKISIGGRDCFISTGIDVTERNRLNRELEESRELQKAIVDSTPDWIFSVDARDFALTSLNAGFAEHALRTTGRRPEVGMKVRDLLGPDMSERWLGYFQRAVAEGSFQIDYLALGNVVLQLTFHALRQDGDVFGISVFGRDVTEVSKAQEAIRASEEMFATAFRSAPILVELVDLETGKYLDVNEESCRSNGYTHEELVGHTGVELGWATPEQHAQMLAAGRTGRIDGVEVARRSRSGEIREGIMFGERITVAGRDCLILTSIDVTERRRLERELSEVQILQSAVADSTHDWMWAVDAETFGLTWWNRAFGDYIKRTRHFDPRVGMAPARLFDDSGRRELWQMRYRRAVDQGWFRTEHEASGGRVLQLTFHALSGAAGPFGISVFGRDITEAKQAESALRESEARFRSVSENSLSGISILDEHHFRYVNPAFADIFGYERDELLRLPSETVIFPDDRPAVQQAMRRRVAGEPGAIRYQTRGLRKDGSVIRLLTYGSRVELEGRWFVLVNMLDITESSKAEEAVRESEARFRAVIENSLSGICIIDEGRFKYVNRAYAAIFGYEPDELTGREITLVAPPEEQERLLQSVQLRSDTGTSELRYEARGLKKDGSPVDLLVLGSSVVLDGKPLTVTNLLDITDLRRLESDLRQSQKLEALGRLAGGVAHDFNNLLTAIGGYARLLQEDLATGRANPEDAGRIIEAANRAAAMTSRLLAFSGRRTKTRGTVDVTQSVTLLLPILRRIVPERVEIKTLLQQVPTLTADSSEVDQVILNLVVNASDAISGNGSIEIGTSLVYHDEAYLVRHERAAAGPHVRLTVADSGSGMDENTRAHIFEPFFTTKPTGTGTGLGLATVFGIVKAMDGSIGIDSEVGVGTTFTIDFPLGEDNTDLVAPESESLARGMERILLVEDEPMVLALSEMILRRLGYDVTAIADPQRAVELPASEFDLLITDVIMPGMDGPEVARRMRAGKPEMPVLYVSGYRPHEAMAAAMDEARSSLLAKPFTWASLAEAVRAALDGPSSGSASGS